MPPYTLIGIENLIFMFGVGIVLVIVVVLARESRRLGLSLSRRTPEQEEQDVKEFGGEVQERHGPLPWLIVLVFCGYFIWAVAYVVFSGARGL